MRTVLLVNSTRSTMNQVPMRVTEVQGVASRFVRRRFKSGATDELCPKLSIPAANQFKSLGCLYHNRVKMTLLASFIRKLRIKIHATTLTMNFVQGNQSSATWYMTNLRRALDFRYYSRQPRCTGNYTLIAKSSVIQPISYNEPTHIHIAYGDRIDQMYVSYLTNSSQYTPQCQYGLSPASLNFRQNGTSTTYRASDMCEGKATIIGPQNFIDPGYIHTMLLEDLRPSTTYFLPCWNR